MKIEFSKRFVRKYKKLDSTSQDLIKRCFTLLAEDYSYPSLRVKKMQGYRNPNVWEASANMDLRITFELRKPDTIYLRNCGHHDETLNQP